MNSLDNAELFIRITIFISVLALFAILEAIFPRRTRTRARGKRWPANLGISIINQIAARLIMPITAVAAAAYSIENGIGALNLISMPTWLEVLIGVLLLDLVIYVQHRVFHRVPVFWRLHRMHHTDTDFDVTTAIRFHPVEIVLSACIKIGAIFVIGPSVLAVLVFEILLNGISLFNHSNLDLSVKLDRFIRFFVVTPDMHRVHHSVRREETNSNYGFNFPWWDRFFGTYCAQPTDGHDEMTIGLEYFRDERELRLDRLLIQPFKTHNESRG